MANQRNKWLVGVVASVTVLTVSQQEGRRNDPYDDLAGIATVCYGETNVAMHHYSNAECDAMLKQSLVKYGDGILQCINVPITQYEHAAYSSFAYNAGVKSFCGSSLLAKLNRGDHRGACLGLMAWDKARIGSKLETVKGLHNRRVVERDLCLKGVA